MKYAGWLVLGLLVGVLLALAYDHWDLVTNRKKLSGAEQVLAGFQGIFA